MYKSSQQTDIFKTLLQVISETNGITLYDTLELATKDFRVASRKRVRKVIGDFRRLLDDYERGEVKMSRLMRHPVALALYDFFQLFPLRYQENHVHLTGALPVDFVYQKLRLLWQSKQADFYRQQIREVYGENCLRRLSKKEVESLLRLPRRGNFSTYLKRLFLTKLVLNNFDFPRRQIHRQAAFAMAEDMYKNYNIGFIRLKYTFSRATQMPAESVPGLGKGEAEDTLLGLYQGFIDFKRQHPDFNFILSPSFRKERDFFDKQKYSSKEEHFLHQVDTLLALLKKYPYLQSHVKDVDTVGDERELYRKNHYKEMQKGIRKLQQAGLAIRSHHGEVWHTLGKGIQAVDNAMNIWHIDTLEHGLSLGINPNYYFHSLFLRVVEENIKGKAIAPASREGKEIEEMEWGSFYHIKDKIFTGKKLTQQEIYQFIKVKHFTALEIEHYQHDVLNRMINKGVSLTSLPTSNLRLAGVIPDYKDHPFSWWEKKGIRQSIGTDNYIALDTDFIKEMLILLFADARELKITKLLMVATGDNRRPLLSKMLWEMRKKFVK